LDSQAVVVPEEPPAVCLADPTTLLYEARDTAAEPMENTEAARTKGWWKTALLALYIKPGVLDLRDEGFQWVDGWQKSFTAVAGRVLVAPLLSVLLLNRHPRQVKEEMRLEAKARRQSIRSSPFVSPDKPIILSPKCVEPKPFSFPGGGMGGPRE